MLDNITINRVELRGRIGQDPKIAEVGGSKVARFSIATSEIYKDRTGTIQEEITWHNVTAWAGKNIEDFSRLKKGSLVTVNGRIRNTKYTSVEGEDRHYTDIVANRLVLIPVRPGQEEESTAQR